MKNIKLNRKTHSQSLKDLISVGPATLEDFEKLGIDSLEELSSYSAESLYQKLCDMTQIHHDICVQDVFSAAIAQAKNPNLPLEQCQWWYWSRMRKAKNDSK